MKIGKIGVYTIDELAPDIQERLIEAERNNDNNPPFGWEENIQDELKEFLQAQGMVFNEMSYTGFWSQGDGARVTLTTDSGFMERFMIEEYREKQKQWGDNHTYAEIPVFWTEYADPRQLRTLREYYLSNKKLKDSRGRAPIDSFTISVYAIPSRYYHPNTLEVEWDLDVDWNESFWNEKVPGHLSATHEDILVECVSTLAQALLEWTREVADTLYNRLEAEYVSWTTDDVIKDQLRCLSEDGRVFTIDGIYIDHLIIK